MLLKRRHYEPRLTVNLPNINKHINNIIVFGTVSTAHKFTAVHKDILGAPHFIAFYIIVVYDLKHLCP